jgi:hypothetical protein
MTPEKPNPAAGGATGSGRYLQRHASDVSWFKPPAPLNQPKNRARLRPLRKTVAKSKSGPTPICFKLQREMAILRREMASLQAALRPKPATVDNDAVAARETAKQKRAEDRETAKQEHAALSQSRLSSNRRRIERARNG